MRARRSCAVISTVKRALIQVFMEGMHSGEQTNDFEEIDRAVREKKLPYEVEEILNQFIQARYAV